MKKSVEKKLRAINKRVPQEWQDAVIKTQYVAPDLRNEILAVLAETPETDEEAKEQRRLQNMFDAGYYDAEESIVDEEIAKKIEEWVDAEVQKAIDAGEIPDPKKDDDVKKLVKKTKRNVKRKQESSLRTKQRGKG